MNISKMLEGAKCCLRGISCYGCPYYDDNPSLCDCKRKLMMDLMTAINNLRKKTRLLSLEEVKKIPADSDVWLELSTTENLPTIITAATVIGVGVKGISFFGNSYDFSAYNHRIYGWRCWTGRPTEKQVKGEPWNN